VLQLFRRGQAEWPKALEALVNPVERQSVRTESRFSADRFSLPSGVGLEVVRGACHRRPVAVVQDDQTAGTYKLAEIEEIDEHVVERMAPVDERGVSHEPLGHEPGKRLL
jgi:hypothetical protein